MKMKPIPGTIDGSVTSFVLDDGATPTWSVKLMEATLPWTGHNALHWR